MKHVESGLTRFSKAYHHAVVINPQDPLRSAVIPLDGDAQILHGEMAISLKPTQPYRAVDGRILHHGKKPSNWPNSTDEWDNLEH